MTQLLAAIQMLKSGAVIRDYAPLDNVYLSSLLTVRQVKLNACTDDNGVAYVEYSYVEVETPTIAVSRYLGDGTRYRNGVKVTSERWSHYKFQLIGSNFDFVWLADCLGQYVFPRRNVRSRMIWQ